MQGFDYSVIEKQNVLTLISYQGLFLLKKKQPLKHGCKKSQLMKQLKYIVKSY